MTQKYAVYLTGADKYQWALKEDYDQTRAAIEPFCDIMPAEKADILYSVYWEALKEIPESILRSKKVICNLSGEWARYEKDFQGDFLRVAPFVDIWVVRSRKAQEDVRAKGHESFYIPYTVNTDIFKPLNAERRAEIRRKLKIPEGAYVIGNFMRDSEGGNLRTPKLVKGPDIFAEIASLVYDRHKNMVVLLAGPRRHWLRTHLREKNIPFIFAGYKVFFDDMRINTLHRSRLNELYNALDLSIVSSRSEAGPHAVLEAAAAQCPQISTRVGIAPDILSEGELYKDAAEAAEKICNLIMQDRQTGAVLKNYVHVTEGLTAAVMAPLFQELFLKLEKAA